MPLSTTEQLDRMASILPLDFGQQLATSDPVDRVYYILFDCACERGYEADNLEAGYPPPTGKAYRQRQAVFASDDEAGRFWDIIAYDGPVSDDDREFLVGKAQHVVELVTKGELSLWYEPDPDDHRFEVDGP